MNRNTGGVHAGRWYSCAFAKLARTTTAEVGEAATSIGGGIASAAKDQANTMLAEFEAIARRNPLGVVIGAFGIACSLV